MTTQQLITVPELTELGFSHFRDRAWRENQQKVTEIILNSEHKFTIVQAPTGFGKSPVTMAAGKLVRPKIDRMYGKKNYPPQSAVLTATKQLQRQYLDDFSDWAKEVRGRANFPCLIDDTLTAADGACTVSSPSATDADRCPQQNVCGYYVQQREALVAQMSIHSYAYFLTAANYTGNFGQQSLLVLDEGHLIDDMLMGFVAAVISERHLNAFKIPMPAPLGIEVAWDEWCEWARRHRPAVVEQLIDLEPLIKVSVAHRRRYKQGEALLKSFDTILTSTTPWVCEPTKSGWELKPTWIGAMANEVLYRHGKRVAIMSATILDHEIFCELIGIDPAMVTYVNVPSTFPVGRKPVYYDPAWYGKRGADIAPLVQKVTEIVRKEAGNKGLIHCVSYEVARAIMSGVPNDVRARLITHESANRQDVYDEFRLRKDDCVLLSPSMKEGVSLEDEQCRFVIVAKLPYPYLGSPQIKERMATSLGKRWYPWKTTCDLIQMCGRGMRSAEDWCNVYLLDAAFERLFSQMAYAIPRWWIDDLVDVGHRLNLAA